MKSCKKKETVKLKTDPLFIFPIDVWAIIFEMCDECLALNKLVCKTFYHFIKNKYPDRKNYCLLDYKYDKHRVFITEKDKYLDIFFYKLVYKRYRDRHYQEKLWLLVGASKYEDLFVNVYVPTIRSMMYEIIRRYTGFHLIFTTKSHIDDTDKTRVLSSERSIRIAQDINASKFESIKNFINGVCIKIFSTNSSEHIEIAIKKYLREN